jgi:hypothetical protein
MQQRVRVSGQIKILESRIYELSDEQARVAWSMFCVLHYLGLAECFSENDVWNYLKLYIIIQPTTLRAMKRQKSCAFFFVATQNMSAQDA